MPRAVDLPAAAFQKCEITLKPSVSAAILISANSLVEVGNIFDET
jgi:hypothetical protein